MTPDRWSKIEEVFQTVVERDPGEREAYLTQICADDDELRREVESLLAHENPDEFIREPIKGATRSLVSASDRDLIGQRIGSYRVTEFIGYGGMGAVYRALRDDDQFQQQVAIKIVKRGMATEFVLRRFRHERRILAKLEHPHIARLLDGGTTEDGLPYFVMEYVEGLPLTKYCEENDLSLHDRLRLFRQICAAVQYAHQNLVIHRDLKPGNILVTKDGAPKLLDFGIAKLLDPDPAPDAPAPTETALRIMTPDYASPEQLSGASVSTASDVYSLGIVLYELLTGARPRRFKNYSPLEIERALREAEIEKPSAAASRNPRPPAKLSRRLAGDLDNIALTALRKEPERRYQSAEQLSDDLRRHLEGRPVKARPDTVAYRASKFINRHKAGVAAAALTVLSLLGGLIATNYQARRAERRFQQVRKLANTFLFDIHDKIASLPGSTETRELTVKTALKYLDSLAHEAEDDPALAVELAVAYQKVGDVQGDPWAANLGHAEAAMKSYRKSLELAEKLVARDGGNLEARRTLAQSYFKLGILLAENGNKVGGQASLRQGVLLAESLAEQTGQESDLALVIDCYTRIGNTQLDTGDAAGALTSYRYVQQLSERRAAKYPNDSARGAVAFAHSSLGEALAAKGDLAGAIESYQQSLATLEALIQKDPSDPATPGRRRGVMIACFWLGSLSGNPRFINLGNRAAALEYHRKALVLAEGLAAADAKNAASRLDLVSAHLNVAEVLAEDDPAQSADLLRRALALTRAQLEIEPNDFRFLRWQALCLKGLAAPLERMGNRQGARQNLRQAQETLQKLAARDPANANIQTDLCDAWHSLAGLALRTGDIAGAQEHYRQALAIAEAAVARMPSHLNSQWRLAESYAGLGQCQATLASDSQAPLAERIANWREARVWRQKALDVWDRWSQQAVSSVFNTTRREQAARAVGERDAALGKLGAVTEPSQ